MSKPTAFCRIRFSRKLPGASHKTPEELLEIKGIKEKKLARYGKEILALVNEESSEEIIIDIEKEDRDF